MKISKKGNKIIAEIDLWQHKCNPYSEEEEKELTSNIVGIICGEEQGLAYIIDLSYKGSFDYSEIFLKTDFEREDFIKLCKELGIVFFEYPICAYCKKPIFGSFTYGDKGNLCFDCELDLSKKDDIIK